MDNSTNVAPSAAKPQRRVRKWRWLLATLVVLCLVAVTGMAVSRMTSSTPRVAALLMVERHQPYVLTPSASREDEQDFEAYREKLAALAKSRLVLNTALRQKEVAQLPIV